MNLRGIYRIFEEPVPLEKVFDGLWVSSAPQAPAQTADDYFSSATLFKEPMSKAKGEKASPGKLASS